MAKVVQRTLKEEEYKAFKEAFEKKGLTIREGLKLAVGTLQGILFQAGLTVKEFLKLIEAI